LFGQKKFLVALSAGIAAYRETGNVWAGLAPVVAYIIAQGVADMGKERVKAEAAYRG